MRVAVDGEVDVGDRELIGVGEGCGVDPGATYDVHVFLVREKHERLADRVDPLRPRRHPLGIARHDDVAAAGQRAEAVWERVPGFPAHHDSVSRRELLEPCHVGREMPWDAAVSSDHAVVRDGGDQRDRHTATGARIAGWCW